MDLPANVFQWLVKLSVMQEAYVATRHPAKGKKGPQVVTVTQQAANAVLSGHALYYVCYNVAFAQGIPFTSSSLVGNPGDECSGQAALYNWQILADVFGSLGFHLSQDHRDLIVAGDVKILAELMKDLYIKYSGEASVETQQKRWASPAGPGASTSSIPATGSAAGVAVLTPLARRDGAASVDSGLKQLKESKKRALDTGVSQSRQRFLAKIERERAAAEAKAEVDRRAEEMRLRVSASIDFSKFREEADSVGNHPVFMEFQNRGAVGYCLGIIEEIVESIESGEAQEMLAAKERARQQARRAARERKLRGNRLVDQISPMHLPPAVDHKIALMVASIVRGDIVELALRDDVHSVLQQRADARQKERGAVDSMLSRLDRQMERSYAKQKPLKHADAEAMKQEEREQAQRRHERKMEKLRRENMEAARVAEQKAKLEREEQQAKEKLEAETRKRLDAETTLYYAEQKAKVVERRRERELLIAQEAERKRQEEEMSRVERRKVGMELNKKLQEKEQARLKAVGRSDGSHVPATLSAFNHGTGDHAAYFGDTLGWQYLTETEFDVAQMVCQARSDPSSMVPCLEQKVAELQGKTLFFTDESGKRHPSVMCEGRPALLSGIEYLGKMKMQKPIDDISIGLTLAARQHAIDLAYHGKAMVEHTGTDGSTLTQRVLRYGAPAMRHGSVELVSCVVRPSTLRLGPVEMVTRFIVDEGDPSRRMRDALFNLDMHESAGVGHALAEFEGLVVEAYVVILSFGFLDKPVAQMAAAHYTGVRAVAAPFLDGLRRVHHSMAERRKLLSAVNTSIGKIVDAKPNVDYLSNERLLRSKKAQGVSRGRQHSPSSESAHSYSHGHDSVEEPPPAPAPKREPTAAEQLQYQANHKRVARFYRKYAPAKLNIIDDALQLFEGRFQELVDLLVNKYGPEPPPTPPPSNSPRDPPPPPPKSDTPPPGRTEPSPTAHPL
jgi:hypothetical protein